MKLFLLSVLALFLAACSGPGDEPNLARDLEAALLERIAEQPDAFVAVSVRDPETDLSLDINADTLLHAASTMKVPVMIEVFRQAAEGRFSMDDSLLVRNEFRSIVDSSVYHMDLNEDSDEAIYERIDSRMTVEELVYQMITVSSNLATNILIDLVSADAVQRTIERLGVKRMRVLRGVEDILAYEQGLNNTATAADLAALMLAIHDGRAVSREASAQMVAILSDQRFNDMIPAELPEGTKVAHKTGWITRIHHDAAIVYPPDDRAYVLVVLTRGIEDPAVSARLVADLALIVQETLRSS